MTCKPFVQLHSWQTQWPGSNHPITVSTDTNCSEANLTRKLSITFKKMFFYLKLLSPQNYALTTTLLVENQVLKMEAKVTQ